MNARSRYVRGFTLIEVVIVLSVLSILASLAVPRYAHTVVRADAVDLRSRLANVEFAAAQYVVEASSGLPAAAAPGVIPAELDPWVEADGLRPPYDVSMQYLHVSAVAWGGSGTVAAIAMRAGDARSREILEALKANNPSSVLLVSQTVALYSLGIGTGRAGIAGGNPGGGSQNPGGSGASGGTQATGTTASGGGGNTTGGGQTPGASTTQPTTSVGGSSSTSPSGTGTSGTGTGSGSNPPSNVPAVCLTGQLPPGQQARCGSGGGSSHWFRASGSNGNG